MYIVEYTVEHYTTEVFKKEIVTAQLCVCKKSTCYPLCVYIHVYAPSFLCTLTLTLAISLVPALAHILIPRDAHATALHC